MQKLVEKVKQLDAEVKALQKVIKALYAKSNSGMVSWSSGTGLRNPSDSHPSDVSTGLSGLYGGMILWNDAELSLPPWGSNPGMPTKGYQKHTHSEFAGGALDITALTLVEYELDGSQSIHSQGFWRTPPPIKTVTKVSDGSTVEMLGLLGLVFDAENGNWSGAWVPHTV